MSTMAAYLSYALYFYIAYKMTEGYVRRFGPVWYHGWIIGFPAVLLSAVIYGLSPEIPKWITPILSVISIQVVKGAYANVKLEREGGAKQQEA